MLRVAWYATLLPVCLLVLGLTGCQHPPRESGRSPREDSDAAQAYSVRGVVREIRPDRLSAVIRHEEIPGYMAAMTMPFEVRDSRVLDGVMPGDTVSFRLRVTDTDGWIDQMTVVKTAEPEDPKPKVEEVRVTRLVEELKEGDVMPDYPLMTEQRQAIRLSQFKGKALGLTFIYTRCPYPNFCPRQSRQFAEACQRLRSMTGGPTNWHLLSISFDPAHDTPSVLLEYARKYDYQPAHWNFATGAMIEIDAITEQFGMFFARDGDGFSHNVRTVVIDAAGRIQRIFVGNEWTVEALVNEMVRAAQVRGP